MKAIYIFIVLCCCFFKVQAQTNPFVITESPKVAVTTDGVLEEQEWLEAKTLTIKGISNGEVTLLLRYDADNLYVAFTDLVTSDQVRLNPEVLIQTDHAEANWNAQSYWFHASYSNCSATGQYYDWEDCSTQPLGWTANTYPFLDDNNTIEFKISFSKLNINPEKGRQINIAFKISDPMEQHAYWPEAATIAKPDTWGTIRFN